MENNMTIIMIGIIVAAVLLVVFMIIRNQKDMKELNPDSADMLNEEKMEQSNDRIKI